MSKTVSSDAKNKRRFVFTKKRVAFLLASIVVLGAVAGALWYWLSPEEEPIKDTTPQILSEKATDDFSDLFRLTDAKGSALAIITVTNVEEVQDVVEYYEFTDTLYTKVTGTVDRDYTDRLDEPTVTLMIPGNSANFPTREVMEVGNSYLLRLDPWVHQDGKIYLINALETTYLRLHQGNVLVRENARLPDYKIAMTADEFADALAAYRKENPADKAAGQAHLQSIVTTLEKYDYQNQKLAVQLDQTAIEARLALAKELAK